MKENLIKGSRLRLPVLALAFSATASLSLPAAADVKTAHGTACRPSEFVLDDGGSWEPGLYGLRVYPGSQAASAHCSITRDDSLQPIDEVRVGVNPSSTSVTCYVVSLSQTGILAGYEYSSPQTSSGGSGQILTFSGGTITNLDEYDNGTYHVDCQATSAFTVLSVWWDET